VAQICSKFKSKLRTTIVKAGEKIRTTKAENLNVGTKHLLLQVLYCN